MKTEKGTRVIAAPNIPAPGFDIGKLGGTCFSTDDRSFDESPDASARVTVDLTLRFSGRREFAIAKSEGNDAIVKIGVTRNVDCKTGQDVQPPLQASVDSVSIGDIKKNGFLRIFNVKGSAADPFYKVFGWGVAPRLDFDVVFEYDSLATELRIKGYTGSFPSFEGYARVDGKTSRLFALKPADGVGAFSLIDFWLGFNSRNFSGKLDLTEQFVR